MEVAKKGRGLSSSSKAAHRYLEKNPGTTAKDLAKKFKIDLSTIYRAPWWINKNKGENNV